MKKLNFYLLVIGLIFVFCSCNKDENLTSIIQEPQIELNKSSTSQSSMKLEEISDISSVIDFTSIPDISTEYDAIVFYVGTALAKVCTINEYKETIREFYNKSSTSKTISELCTLNPKFKTILNLEIDKLLKEMDVYSTWKEERFSKNNQLDLNFDYFAFFEEIIYEYNSDETLMLYQPEILNYQNNQKDSRKIYIGLDLPTLNKEQALLFEGKYQYLLSAENVNSIDGQFLFVGIYNPFFENDAYAKNPCPEGCPFTIDKDWKLPKWHHFGKVFIERDPCIDVQWKTQYRWYSGWNIRGDLACLSEFGINNSSIKLLGVSNRRKNTIRSHFCVRLTKYICIYNI